MSVFFNKRTQFIIFGILLLCLFTACSNRHTAHHQKVIIAQISTPVKHVYFSGIIQPINTIAVLSPVEGHVESLHFVYGQSVKQGQVLVTINSIKLMDDFRSAVSSFLSKKTTYLNQVNSFQAAQVLYKAGVIDQDDFQSEQSQYENTVLDYFNQEYQLKKVLLKAGVNPAAIEKLSITDINNIQKLFAHQFNHVRVMAPASGIALFPLTQNQATSSSDDQGQNGGVILVGSNLHESQLILSIGNLNGLAIDMNVSEVDVNKLHRGMSAFVSGDAFPNITMKGVIAYVASQAQPDNGDTNAMSLFKVTVTVPAFSAHWLSSVHVGMTAKVDIPIAGVPHVMLPLNAVFEKAGKTYVTIVTPSGTVSDEPVIVGDTTANEAIILSGVNAGQQVVIHDSF